MKKNKKILFISGTRADFGKLKPLIKKVMEHRDFEYQIFGTGMHLMSKYGNTIKEIEKSGFTNLFTYMNQVDGENMEVILANTIKGLSRYLHENHFDLIVVHGDRVEALAGAIVGALRNILVAHVEGGEISGTVDELMRHAISKLSHIHFVVSESAEKRLVQLGESQDAVFKIGSPDIDVMLSDDLPDLGQVKERYQIDFSEYAIGMFHPVTTEIDVQAKNTEVYFDALIASNNNYILIFPNNDLGSSFIFDQLKRVENNKRFKIFPSIRFEYFLTMMKYAQFVIGNSSAGIHEAPIYGVPTINIGSRQNNRFKHESIHNVQFASDEILKTIEVVKKKPRYKPSTYYGNGKSADKFIEVIEKDIWQISNQKKFKDLLV